MLCVLCLIQLCLFIEIYDPCSRTTYHTFQMYYFLLLPDTNYIIILIYVFVNYVIDLYLLSHLCFVFLRKLSNTIVVWRGHRLRLYMTIIIVNPRLIIRWCQIGSGTTKRLYTIIYGNFTFYFYVAFYLIVNVWPLKKLLRWCIRCRPIIKAQRQRRVVRLLEIKRRRCCCICLLGMCICR